jgi:SAM-dependent methyltransferase
VASPIVGLFSHAFSIHPASHKKGRLDLFQEMLRLLYPGGQALIAMPLKGSYQEIADLFREGRNPIEVLKWKEIYDGLEDACDQCKDFTHIIGNVVIKNA